MCSILKSPLILLTLQLLFREITAAPENSQVSPPCKFLTSDKSIFEILHTAEIPVLPSLPALSFESNTKQVNCKATHYCGHSTVSRESCPDFMNSHYTIEHVYEMPILNDLSDQSLILINETVIFSNPTSPVEVIVKLTQVKPSHSNHPSYNHDVSENPNFYPGIWDGIIITREIFTNSDKSGYNATSIESCRTTLLFDTACVADPILDNVFKPFRNFMARYSELVRGSFGFRSVEGFFGIVDLVGGPTSEVSFKINGTDGVTRGNFEETMTFFENLWIEGCKCVRELPHRDDFTSASLGRRCFKLNDNLRRIKFDPKAMDLSRCLFPIEEAV